MYDLINLHITRLLDTVDPNYDIAPYIAMQVKLRQVDVSRDEEFRNEYLVLLGAQGFISFRAHTREHPKSLRS